jgi:integrase
MPRGQKPGWKLSAGVPKVLPSKPVRVATGVWLTPYGAFAAYLYFRGVDRFIGSFASVQEAVDAREQKRQELRMGRPILRRTESALTVGAFAEHVYFPETLALVKDSTARTTMSRYRQHVLPAFHDVPLRDVTYDLLCGFRSVLMAKDVSGQTRREALLILRAILEEAARRGLIPTNPAALVQLPPKGGRPISVPSSADALRVVAAITHPVARMAASLLLRSGMRLNEALSLEWTSVDLDAGTIFVAHSIDQVAGKIVAPKTATAVRVVEIPSDLVAELKVYRAEQEAGRIQRNDPWVFPAGASGAERIEGRPPVMDDRNLVQRYWEPAVKAVGCARFTPHALRHLYASKLLMGGTPVAYVAQQLGHASPAFTYKQYTRFLRTSPDAGKAYLERAFGSG